jgi:puromycin-sensitive aminopeptidase
MEVLAVDGFRPEWQRWVSFGVEREAAMAVDGLHATRPVEFAVGRPEEAQGMFDVLTYQKGGSVLRMLEQYLGAETFRDGIRDYLTTHSYSNTETADLWNALERSSGQPVREIMDTWIYQGGYPLIRLADDESLSQEPFSYRGEPGGAIGSSWQIPALVRSLSGSGGEPVPVLIGDDGAPASSLRATDPLVNAGGSGFYRVAYPTAVVERLSAILPELEPLERYNLVSDSWAAALSGQAPVTDVLRLGRALSESGERDPSVWSVVIGALGLLDRVVPDADRPVLQEAVQALLGPVAEQVGWDPKADDGERTPSLRASVLRTLGTVGADQAVRDEASRRFEAARSGGDKESALHPDTESAVLEIVATTGGTAEYEVYLERYRKPTNPQEENRYLYGLAAFDQPELAQRTYDLATTEVRTQNAPFVLQLLIANRETGPASWQRITTEWDSLVERFPANILPRMLDGVRTLCRTPEQAEAVATFVQSHPLPAGGKTVEQILERLDVNVAFGQRIGTGLAQILADVAAS